MDRKLAKFAQCYHQGLQFDALSLTTLTALLSAIQRSSYACPVEGICCARASNNIPYSTRDGDMVDSSTGKCILYRYEFWVFIMQSQIKHSSQLN